MHQKFALRGAVLLYPIARTIPQKMQARPK